MEFNRIEAVFWFVMAGAAAGLAIRAGGRVRRWWWLAAFLLVLFGLSDLVEIRTGAWWRPSWLLAWKGACLAGLLGVLLRARRAGRP